MVEAAQANAIIHLTALITSLLLSWLITTIAMKAGFYKMPAYGPYPRIPTYKDVVLTFAAFFVLQLILFPLIAYLLLSYQAGTLLSESFKIPEREQLWVNSMSMWASAFLLLSFYSFFQPTIIRSVSDSESTKHSPFYNFCFGSMSWLISYPIVLVMSHLLGAFITYVFNEPETQQAALKILKNGNSSPLELLFYLSSIVIIVPILEEFLFRGILQRWIINKIGMFKGIALTSLIFASLHFAATLKSYNLQLLPPLFVLSCYLGFLYERQRSLWAPIGLHTTFNLVSSLFALSYGG